MSGPRMSVTPVAPPRAARPGWWLVFRRELAELWTGGRALALLLLFSALMSVTAFLLATNTELSLTPPRLAMVVALQSAITFGLFIGLVVGAESISGERERATLEPLLLTPVSRRQIVIGKYLAALSPWPLAMLVAAPYVVVLARGDPAIGSALVWGAIGGSLVTLAFTGVGMLTSFWSGSNRTSLFVSLVIYFVALLPGQLPGEFQATAAGAILQATNPLDSTGRFLTRYLVDGIALDEARTLLIAPAVAIVLIAVALLVAAPRLQLEGGGARAGRLRMSDLVEQS